METLVEYIAGRSVSPTRRELNRIIDSHEWFTTARRARALATGEPDPALTLPLMFWLTVPPVPVVTAAAGLATYPARPTEPEEDVRAETASAGDETAAELIDRFIEHGGYRIVPSDEAPGVDVEIDIDPEMVTEELAEIYRSQGLIAEAEKIYRILNLRNS